MYIMYSPQERYFLCGFLGRRCAELKGRKWKKRKEVNGVMDVVWLLTGCGMIVLSMLTTRAL